MKHVVILGGGFGGVECYRKLTSIAGKKVRITLINRDNYSLFTPMLHEVATGSISRKDIVQPLREFVTCCHNHFIEADVTSVDVKKKIVKTSAKDIEYDFLVVALGSITNYFNCEGAQECAFPLKNMDDAITLRNHILDQYETAAVTENKKEREECTSFVIVGGGLTGVEMAGQLADFIYDMRELYPEIPNSVPKITLVHAGDRILPRLAPISSRKAKKVLLKKGVDCELNNPLARLTPEVAILKDGTKIKTRTTIWATGIKSSLPGILPATLLNDRGLIEVGNDLSCPKYPEIFGVGDVVSWIGEKANPPSTAQAATKAGNIAAQNIWATIQKKDKIAFEFKSKGDLVPIGDWYAVAEIGKIKFAGKFAWWMRRTVFIQRLWNWTNRLRVVADWTLNIFRPRDTSKL
ncbi:MAG: hypothetical protein CMI52_02535 [Parcubacteria group bacterium]|nr:hypothetical protein [Parcubacteria group bacterium]|tara:strand:+ start:1401 stop:2624 length:1224 start_codon:yes stop_codon:yes gene_type:complete